MSNSVAGPVATVRGAASLAPLLVTLLALHAASAAAQAPFRTPAGAVRFPAAPTASPLSGLVSARDVVPGDTVPRVGMPATLVPATLVLTGMGTAVSTGSLALMLFGEALSGDGPYTGLLVLSALAPGVGGYLGSGTRASLPLTLLASAAPVLVAEVAGGLETDTPEALVLAVPVAQLVGTALVALRTSGPVSDP